MARRWLKVKEEVEETKSNFKYISNHSSHFLNFFLSNIFNFEQRQMLRSKQKILLLKAKRIQKCQNFRCFGALPGSEFPDWKSLQN